MRQDQHQPVGIHARSTRGVVVATSNRVYLRTVTETVTAGVAVKTFARFIADDIKRLESGSEIGELMTDNAVNDAQRMSDRLIQIRRSLRELLSQDDDLENKWSRYFATAKRQGTFRVKQVVMTAQLADFRIRQLRSGLQDLLILDDELDDEWLRRFGLTRWDTLTTTEDTDVYSGHHERPFRAS